MMRSFWNLIKTLLNFWLESWGSFLCSFRFFTRFFVSFYDRIFIMIIKGLVVVIDSINYGLIWELPSSIWHMESSVKRVVVLLHFERICICFFCRSSLFRWLLLLDSFFFGNFFLDFLHFIWYFWFLALSIRINWSWSWTITNLVGWNLFRLILSKRHVSSIAWSEQRNDCYR